MPPAAENTSPYLVGIMKTPVGPDRTGFDELVDGAARRFEALLGDLEGLEVRVLEFTEPALRPGAGGYSPLDFLRIGLVEKLERRVNFLLVVTEVELSASTRSYTLALPSRLANIAVVSTRRLIRAGAPDTGPSVSRERLAVLMLHAFGHLLNLSHAEDRTNVMFDFGEVDSLDDMHEITGNQLAEMHANLPREARDEVAGDSRLGFSLRQLAGNARSILRTLVRANPLSLARRLPTMLTAALSLVIVVFFSAEAWDVASTLSFPAVAVFSAAGVVVAAWLLYGAFNIDPGRERAGGLSESAVVMAGATFLSLLLTMTFIYAALFGLSFAGGIVFFPEPLKETWPTVGSATALAEEAKLAMFLAGLGVLAGSLGGRADRAEVIRHILFTDEEA